MKAAALSTLLLAMVALVSGEGGAISVLNNGAYRPTFVVQYQCKNVMIKQEMTLNPGENKTALIPEDAEDIVAAVFLQYRLYNRTIFVISSPKPVETSLKASGSASDPQAGDISLLTADSRSITVVNHGSYCGRMAVRYDRKSKNHNEWAPLSKGMVNVVVIPDEAVNVTANVSYFYSVNPECQLRFLDESINEVLSTTVSGPECHTLSGTHADPEHAKIDCARTHIRLF